MINLWSSFIFSFVRTNACQEKVELWDVAFDAVFACEFDSDLQFIFISYGYEFWIDRKSYLNFKMNRLFRFLTQIWLNFISNNVSKRLVSGLVS